MGADVQSTLPIAVEDTKPEGIDSGRRIPTVETISSQEYIVRLTLRSGTFVKSPDPYVSPDHKGV
jgi:hypothetical protein